MLTVQRASILQFSFSRIESLIRQFLQSRYLIFGMTSLQLFWLGDAFFGRALKVAISALYKSHLAPSPALPNDAGDAGQQGDKNSAQHNDLLREAISLFDATIVEVKPGGGRQSPAVGGSRQNSEDRDSVVSSQNS